MKQEECNYKGRGLFKRDMKDASLLLRDSSRRKLIGMVLSAASIL